MLVAASWQSSAVADGVAGAVDHARRQHRNPQHLDAPHRQADHAEQQHVDHQEQAHALPGKAAVQAAFDGVVRAAGRVACDGFPVMAGGAVEFGAAQQHRAQARLARAVRVALAFAVRMVAAMDGHPFARDHAGGQPQPEAEEMGNQGMQGQGAVRLVAVQVDGDGHDGDVRGQQGVGDDGKGRCSCEPIGQEKQECFHCVLPWSATEAKYARFPSPGSARLPCTGLSRISGGAAPDADPKDRGSRCGGK
jgi:hypothetical protein